MHRQRRSIRAGSAAVCLAVLLVLAGLHPTADAASPGAGTVGVVDFFTPTPLGAFEGGFPERFAADDLSRLLIHAGDDRVAVTPRAAVRRAEASLEWRNEDVLRFDRLEALARAIGADRLVIGWITMLVIDTGGSHEGGPHEADVSVVVQVFDATQGRIVAETGGWAYTVLGTRTILAERGLHLALAPIVPWVLATLAQTP